MDIMGPEVELDDCSGIEHTVYSISWSIPGHHINMRVSLFMWHIPG